MRTLSAFVCLALLAAAGLPATPAFATGASAHHATAAARHRRHLAHAHRNINYGWAPRMPRWDPYEVQAEVHTWYPNRTPYPYPGLFWW